MPPLIDARQELLDAIPENTSIKCYRITLNVGAEYRRQRQLLRKILKLPVNYTNLEYHQHLSLLSFRYYNLFSDEITGTVWLKNGGWLMRGQVDGKDKWIYSKCPEIPEELQTQK